MKDGQYQYGTTVTTTPTATVYGSRLMPIVLQAVGEVAMRRPASVVCEAPAVYCSSLFHDRR